MEHQQHIANKNHHGHHDHHNHHAHMIADFKKRFWISLVITFPIIVLAPMIQNLVGFELGFKGDRSIQFILSSVIFFYGGWPFLKGMVEEIKKRSPGMMTLIALAISVAYFYSSAVVFGLNGKIFFWELASLIVIMLLGHWIEMKSVMGASNALQELAKMMPSIARRIKEDGVYEDVPIADIKSNDMAILLPIRLVI